MSVGEVTVAVVFAVGLIAFIGLGLATDTDHNNSLAIDWTWIGPLGVALSASVAALGPVALQRFAVTLLLFFVAITIPGFVSAIDTALLAAFLFPTGFYFGQELAGGGVSVTAIVAPIATALVASAAVTLLARQKKY